MNLSTGQKATLAIGIPVILILVLIGWHQGGQTDPPNPNDPVICTPEDGPIKDEEPSKPQSKLVVLILRERRTESAVPQALKSAFSSKRLRDTLKEHCYQITGKDGKLTDGFRILDNDTNAQADLPIWQDAMSKFAGKYTDEEMPVIIISDGKKTGMEARIPHNYATDDLVALIRKEAGVK